MPVTEDIHFLPPVGHRSRSLAQTFLFLGPLLCGLVVFLVGQDANWDLRNYHWYNAYAFLNWRYDRDLLPSQTPYFYNPLLDVPYFILATHVPVMLASYILTVVQGLNLVLLFMVSHATLMLPNPRQRVLISGALAVLGVFGGGGIALLGTTFGDNLTSLGILLSAVLVIRHHAMLLTAPLPRVVMRSVFFGLPAGFMMGLKLPSVIFCIGLCGGLLLAGGNLRRRFAMCSGFGVGILLGVVVTIGPWAWFLEDHFQNPLFPYFNEIFQSPLAPLTSARDTQFLTHDLHDTLFFPFIFTENPYRVGEIPWRDWRLAILYVLLPLAVILRLVFGRTRNQTEVVAIPFAVRYLLWAAVISYGVWLKMFCIYRYAVPLEMLTPLLIVFVCGMLPLKTNLRGMITVFLLIVVACSVKRGDWHHADHWLHGPVEADIPPLGDTSDTMMLMAGYQPYSHLLSLFPADLSFLRIQSNFANPAEGKGINAMIRAKLDAHKGRLLLLVIPWERDSADPALNYYGLAADWRSCQTVKDRLYDEGSPVVCPVTRVHE